MPRMKWLQALTRSRPTPAAAEFDRLMRPHVVVMYRSAYRWTGSVERAEDLVQELLVRLYPKLDELRTLDQVRPWAMRVMYRLFVDQLRRERRSPVQFGLDFEEDSTEEGDGRIDPASGPEELTEQQLTQERVLAVWPLLSEEHRIVLSMHDIEDYSLPEVAQVLEVPIGTLKSRLHRARARLRELLSGERSARTERV
ncbi:MAG: RNA polymerase sigma factor [Steroidobacteraceae bacterium]